MLSIDVDGIDWHVRDNVRRYRPRLVVIELNPSIPNGVYFVQDADPAKHHGGTLVLAGCHGLLWAELPIEREAIQVLAPEDRVLRDFSPAALLTD